MVHECADVRGRKLVDEALPRLNRRLRDRRDAVHRVGHMQAVPVNDRRLLELILDRHADGVALGHADQRAGYLAVVADRRHGDAGRDLPWRFLRDELELTDLARGPGLARDADVIASGRLHGIWPAEARAGDPAAR